MLTHVVSDVECWNSAPREELLSHARIVDLVHHDIEVVDLGEGIHLKLATPTAILPDPADVVLYLLIVFDEKLVQFLVLFDVVSALLPVHAIVLFSAFELVTESAEHTVSIGTHFFDFQAEAGELFLELHHI